MQNKLGNAGISGQSCRPVSLVFSDKEILGIKEKILDNKLLHYFPLQFTFQASFIAISFNNLQLNY
jgi:hypothetical protein